MQAVGIEPRSTLMKSIFLIYGSAWLLATVCFGLRLDWAWWAMLGFAIGGLWYLPWGTLLGLVMAGLLVVMRARGN